MRSRKNWQELLHFGLVGLSGVVINMFALIVLTLIGPDSEGPVMRILSTPFHVRWYHAYSFTAFLVANLWNFQLNRMWTFRSRGNWWQQYRAFLVVGVIAQGLGLILLTLFMHPNSPISLPHGVFDDSTLLSTRVYWAQLLTIALVTPASFLLNKFWTFRKSTIAH